jgi:phosphoribosyl 1,2-cyclic phosphodiesterase/CheY-like chemotaxis protein
MDLAGLARLIRLVFSAKIERLPHRSSMKTVLIIDDDKTLQTALSALLKENGWQVIESEDGETGIKLAFQHVPDVVICDLLMPKCNGFQVCRSIRAQQSLLPNVCLVVASSSGYPSDRINAKEAGADEFLVKPIRTPEVVQLLTRLAARQPAHVKAPAPVMAAPPVTPRADISGQPARVKFWGVRGSIPTPGPATVYYGGNTSCLEVRADGQIIILDAGTGLRGCGRRLVEEFKGRSIELTMLITHTHWDHIQGFPFFIPAYNPANKIRIIGYEGARSGLQGTLSSQMESPYFPVSMHEMPGHLSVEELQDFRFQLGSVTVQTAFLNHPGICVGYRLYTSGGSISYLPDNEPYSRLRTMPTSLQADKSYESYTFAQDQDKRLIEFIEGSDILVMDSQYDDAEYQSHVGWGHGCVDDVVAMAMMANVKKLFLFHHDPEHDDDHISRMVAWARELVKVHGESLEVDAAREGVELVLEPKPELVQTTEVAGS